MYEEIWRFEGKPFKKTLKYVLVLEEGWSIQVVFVKHSGFPLSLNYHKYYVLVS